jgi:hypothetical protein
VGTGIITGIQEPVNIGVLAVTIAHSAARQANAKSQRKHNCHDPFHTDSPFPHFSPLYPTLRGISSFSSFCGAEKQERTLHPLPFFIYSAGA